MDWRFVYTRFDGRIGRQQFWIGAGLIFVCALILTIVIASALGGSPLTAGQVAPDAPPPDPEQLLHANAVSGWTNLVVFLIMAWPGLALCLKRRHDRGSDGKLVWVWFGFSLLVIVLQLTGLGYGVQELGEMRVVTLNFLGSIVGLVTGILGLYMLVVLGFLKGDSGDNIYGPNPLIPGTKGPK